MIRAAVILLLSLFAVSHGGLAGAAEHDHRNVHIHQASVMHEHDTGSDTSDHGDEIAVHLHLIADRVSGAQIVPPLSPARSTPVRRPDQPLLSMATAPPIEPPESA